MHSIENLRTVFELLKFLQGEGHFLNNLASKVEVMSPTLAEEIGSASVSVLKLEEEIHDLIREDLHQAYQQSQQDVAKTLSLALGAVMPT